MSISMITVVGLALTDGTIKSANNKQIGKFTIEHVYNGRAGVTRDVYQITRFCYKPELEETVLKVKKGQLTSVVGEFRTQKYVTKTGETVLGLEVIAQEIETQCVVKSEEPAGYDPFAEE